MIITFELDLKNSTFQTINLTWGRRMLTQIKLIELIF